MSTEKAAGGGARPKDRPTRDQPPVDYKKMHSGTVKSGKKQVTLDVTPNPGLLVPGGSAAAAGSDLGHSAAEKKLEDLDREIEELESSIKKVHSKLKETSQRKEKKQRSERIAKLRKELFIAEAQLQKSEEEGEMQSRKHITSDQTVTNALTLGNSTQNAKKTDSSTDVVLSDLRAMQNLNAEVDRDLVDLGVLSDSSSSSDQDSDFDYLGTAKGHKSSHESSNSKKKSLKSGLYKKSADSVKFPQIWPHAALQYEYVSENVSFMSLDVKSFVAGEIEIILSKHTSAADKLGRLRFLKKIMYFANIYEWKALLRFYAAWVRRIEIGLSSWSDSSVELETPMLTKYPLKAKFQQKRDYLRVDEQVWWCSDYNSQSCSFSASSLQKNVKGHTRTVKHICSACYRADKSMLEHPKSSSACPLYKK